MSVISEVVLWLVSEDSEGLAAANRALAALDPGRANELSRIDMSGAGGGKAFTGEIYAGAFNHLSPTEIEAAMLTVHWQHPEAVMLVVEGEDHDRPIYACSLAQLSERRAS